MADANRNTKKIFIVYIYIERERESVRGRSEDVCVCLCLSHACAITLTLFRTAIQGVGSWPVDLSRGVQVRHHHNTICI